VQYLDWAWRLLQGDWGHSFRDGASVLEVIGRHLFATLLLMGTSTALAIAVGTWIGIRGATHRYSTFDHLATVGAMIALSIPTFWFGLVGIYIFSLKLGWLPAGNMYTVGDGSIWDYLHHLILPSIVLALVHVAVWSRYMRTATLDVINQDFVKTARAKGLSERRILMKHVVGNALLPMITLAGMQLPGVLTGALVTETVFTWPGMGRLFLDSIGYGDYPVVMGLLMFSAIFVILGNLIADIAVAIVDPRIRLS
jgi:peptide/nickel transport system permease protein